MDVSLFQLVLIYVWVLTASVPLVSHKIPLDLECAGYLINSLLAKN